MARSTIGAAVRRLEETSKGGWQLVPAFAGTVFSAASAWVFVLLVFFVAMIVSLHNGVRKQASRQSRGHVRE